MELFSANVSQPRSKHVFQVACCKLCNTWPLLASPSCTGGLMYLLWCTKTKSERFYFAALLTWDDQCFSLLCFFTGPHSEQRGWSSLCASSASFWGSRVRYQMPALLVIQTDLQVGGTFIHIMFQYLLFLILPFLLIFILTYCFS